MFEGLWDLIKGNPAIGVTALIGTALGGWGGAALGGSTLTKILLGVVMGAAGLAAGGYLGTVIQNKMDNAKPAPLGLRAVNATPIEPGKQTQVDLKPSVKMVEAAKDTLLELVDEQKKNPDPIMQKLLEATGVAKYAGTVRYVPSSVLASAIPPLTLKGTATADGKTLMVDTLVIDPSKANGLVKSMMGEKKLGPFTFKLRPVALPLKDGQLDDNDPQARVAMQDIIRQSVQMSVVPQYREQAMQAADKLLERAGVAPVPAGTSVGGAPSKDPKKIAEVGTRTGEKPLPGVGASDGKPSGSPLPNMGGKPAESPAAGMGGK
ncbi:MAG: hypothetical protein EBV03_05860 [Proteobacteria bacterium]|nr:hypothetical protein [Pseudomonadota bacterium]